MIEQLVHPLDKEERWRRVDLSGIAIDPDAYEILNKENSKTKPFHIEGSDKLTFHHISEDEELYFPRVAGKVSGHAKVYDENIRWKGINAGVTEIEVTEGASLDYLGVMKYHNSPTFSIRRFILRAGAKAHINFFYEGGSVGKERIEVWLGEGAEAEVNGISTLGQMESINIDTLQYHTGAASKSDLLFLGINRGNGKAVFEGMIRVAEDAVRSSSKLSQQHLLMGEYAKAESIPRLEILADDVVCSHKASVSRPDKNELFYMNSRGLTNDAALTLIEEGFKQKALKRLGKEYERFEGTVPNI